MHMHSLNHAATRDGFTRPGHVVWKQVFMWLTWSYYCLQWEDFLKLGDEIENSVVEEKIKAQKPEQCALLIYTVS